MLIKINFKNTPNSVAQFKYATTIKFNRKSSNFLKGSFNFKEFFQVIRI